MAASVEDFERWVVQQLQGVIQAELDATAARYLQHDIDDGLIDDDGLSLVKLTAPDRYYPGGTNIVTRWPSVEVAVPEDEIENFSIGQTDADVVTRLAVQCWLKDARFDVLNRAVKRYTAAVCACLLDPATLPGHEVDRIRRAWGTNPELDENDDRIQAGGLLVLELRGSWSRVS